MACTQFSANGNERLGQVFYAYAVEVFTQAAIKLHAAKKAAAAKRNVEKVEHAPPGEAAGKFFQFVEFSRQIAAADKCTDGRACNHLDFDARFVKGKQNANMRPAPRGTTTEGQCYFLGFMRDFSRISDTIGRRFAVLVNCPALLAPCKHHVGHLFVSYSLKRVAFHHMHTARFKIQFLCMSLYKPRSRFLGDMLWRNLVSRQ